MENKQKLKMTEIYGGLEDHLKYWKEKKREAEELLNKAASNVEALELSMESLAQCGDFTMTEEEKKEDRKTEEKIEEQKEDRKVEEKTEKKENLEWKHKNARIIKVGMDGTQLGSYKSQQKIADQLKVSGGTISNWMKQPKETQLQKRKFYLAYEY